MRKMNEKRGEHTYTVCAVVAANVYLHVEVSVVLYVPGIVDQARGAGRQSSQQSEMVP